MPQYHHVHLTQPYLTGLFTALNPTVTGGPLWNCVPYNKNMVNAVNANPQAHADIHRTAWFFGKRRENESADVIEVKSEVEEKSDATEGPQFQNMVGTETDEEKSAHFYSHEEFQLYSWVVPPWQACDQANIALSLREVLQNKANVKKLLQQVPNAESILKKIGLEDCLSQTAASNVGLLAQDDRCLNLSLEESQALYAFSVSIGNGHVLQGGSGRGLTRNCFEIGWLFAQGISPNKQDLCIDEPYRLRRLPDGSISASTYYAINSAIDLNPRHYKDKEGLLAYPTSHPIIIVTNEQIFKESKVNGPSIFTMTPHSQEVLIEENVWQKMLEFAMDKCLQLERDNIVFRPADFFVLIPYLEDPQFLKVFCRAMGNQPDFVIDFARSWIEVCYRNQTIGQVILEEFDRDRAIKKQTRDALPENLKPIIITSDNVAYDYTGYLYDPHSNAGYKQAFAAEMENLQEKNPDLHDNVLERVKIGGEKYFGDQFYSFLNAIEPAVFHVRDTQLADLLGDEDKMSESDRLMAGLLGDEDKMSESDRLMAGLLGDEESDLDPMSTTSETKSSVPTPRTPHVSASLFEHDNEESKNSMPETPRDQSPPSPKMFGKAKPAPKEEKVKRTESEVDEPLGLRKKKDGSV